MCGLEIDGGQRDPRLDPPLQLQQLDLQIDRRSEVRLLFFQAPKLDDFSRLGPGLLSFRHGRIVLEPAPSLELGKSSFSFKAIQFPGQVRGDVLAPGGRTAGHARLRVLTARRGASIGCGASIDRWRRNVLLHLNPHRLRRLLPEKLRSRQVRNPPTHSARKRKRPPKRLCRRRRSVRSARRMPPPGAGGRVPEPRNRPRSIS